MKIGLITDSLSHLPFAQALDFAAGLGLSSVEVATGNWSESPHAAPGGQRAAGHRTTEPNPAEAS